jgi:ABC-type nitrate/sulfonate/bicarbonate transport system permease component
MPDPLAAPPAPQSPPLPSGSQVADRGMARHFREFFTIRKDAPLWQTIFLGLACVALCFGAWWFVTRGDPEERILPYAALPSPAETLGSFPSLWFDRELTRNLLTTLRRVGLGFGLAALVGVPLGVLCGCFPRANAFFLPVSIFGRNIPIAALIPVIFSLFGIGEVEKIMFIFIACVAFVVSDTARAVMEVGSPYIDTAYTLGASRLQVILKVLVPLAMPSIFNSLRLLFGLAFGYIMLVELVKLGGDSGGVGDIIILSQRRGPREHIILLLLIIPVVALVIDRILFWIQKELFPYRYGGVGFLNRGLRAVLHVWEDCKSLVWRPFFRARSQALPENDTPGVPKENLESSIVSGKNEAP